MKTMLIAALATAGLAVSMSTALADGNPPDFRDVQVWPGSSEAPQRATVVRHGHSYRRISPRSNEVLEAPSFGSVSVGVPRPANMTGSQHVYRRGISPRSNEILDYQR